MMTKNLKFNLIKAAVYQKEYFKKLFQKSDLCLFYKACRTWFGMYYTNISF